MSAPERAEGMDDSKDRAQQPQQRRNHPDIGEINDAVVRDWPRLVCPLSRQFREPAENLHADSWL